MDLRSKLLDIQKQTALTRDNILVVVDGTVYYKIISPRSALYTIDNIAVAVEELTIATLRSIIGHYTL